MWNTAINSSPASNKNQSYQGPGLCFQLPKRYVFVFSLTFFFYSLFFLRLSWSSELLYRKQRDFHTMVLPQVETLLSSEKSQLIPRRHFSHFVVFSTHHWEDDLINFWRCCWKPTTFYRLHEPLLYCTNVNSYNTPAADSCTGSLTQLNFGEWDFCFGQCYVFLHALTGWTEWVPLGDPIPPPSLSVFCVCGDFQSFFTFLGWTQKLPLYLIAFLSKMNFAVYLIRIIFPEEIPA